MSIRNIRFSARVHKRKRDKVNSDPFKEYIRESERYIIGVQKRIRTRLNKADRDMIHVVIRERYSTETEEVEMKWKCPNCGREFSRRDQDHYCVKPRNIDEDIATQDESVQVKLTELRTVLRAALPDAEERISWSMPTYWKGRNIIHFAATKTHIGLYPGDSAVAAF